MADPPEPSPAPSPRRERKREDTMLPRRGRGRLGIETVFMRVVATGGVVGIGVALAAILVGQDVAGWIVGLVVGLTSVILAALLWSSRQL